MEGTILTPDLEGMKHVKSEEEGEMLFKPLLDIYEPVLLAAENSQNQLGNLLDFPSQADEVPTPTSSRKKGKGKSKQAADVEPSQVKPKKVIPNSNVWDLEDELRLAKSWNVVSENSEQAYAETGSSFWYLVMDEYNSRNPPFVRTKDALSSKWKKLNTHCQKFGNVVKRLQKEWRSKESDHDFRMRCEGQYRLENMKAFTSYHVWDFLKDKPKWLHPDAVVIGRRNAVRRRDTIDTIESEDLNVDEELEDENPSGALISDDPLACSMEKERKAKFQKTSSGSAASSRSSFEDSFTCRFLGIREDIEGYYKRKDLETQLRILAITTDHLPEVDRRVIEKQKARIRARLESLEDGSGSGADI
ncbi:uncharacterized protein [Rutidosis leptorrhynchoides]|uniref:uncharacterized protein isoform X1 n=1 Tax=Rutidosis leptorrhynchoides TaxID=125765 RepID=UPI003A99A375